MVIAAKAVHEHNGAIGIRRPVLDEVGTRTEHLEHAVARGNAGKRVGVRRGGGHRD